jgi:hypothetical protein
MQYQSLIAYICILVFGLTFIMAQANKEREQFADLLQKRKHLNGYWVGKRYAVASSDEDLIDSGKRKSRLFSYFTHCIFCLDEDLSAAKRASYLVGKRGTYLVGKRASYLVGRKRRDLMATDNSRQ